MTFKIPKQYQPPEGTKEGEAFKEMGTFMFNRGMMTLQSLGEDEIPLAEKKPKGGMQAINEQLKAGDTEGEM